MPPRPALTHFLCIPLGGAQLARSLAAFRADVTTDLNAGGFGPSNGAGAIPDGAVRPPGTLHITLGVMSLNDEDVAGAVGLLRATRLGEMLDQARAASAAASAVAPATEAKETPSFTTTATTTATSPISPSSSPGERRNGLRVTLRGLSAMHSPSSTSVLYAPPVDPTLVLRRFCEALKARFTAAGLMVRDERELRLHATVVNTVYVSGRSHRGRGGGRKRERLTLDARDIIDRYEDYIWAEEMLVKSVRICRMRARRVVGSDGQEDEVYDVEGEVKFWAE